MDRYDERAEHMLTLKRTLLAIAYTAGIGVGVVVVFVVGLSGLDESAATIPIYWLLPMFVSALIVGLPVAAGAFIVLRSLGSGRWTRVGVGAVSAMVVGLGAGIIFSAEWDSAAVLQYLVVPAIAGACAGALVGPRRRAPPLVDGPDERAEDALPDGPPEP
jgi:hypothetical protein